MNLLKHFIKECCEPRKLLFITLAALILPNIALCFTENMPWVVNFCNLLLPISIYLLVFTFNRIPGKIIWWLFILIFFCAFQLVLLYLFGNGLISVDMFLNLVTTNTGEVFELLNKLIPGVAGVLLIYIPILLLGIISIKQKYRLSTTFIQKIRKTSLVGLFISIPVLFACRTTTSSFSIKDYIFPANVCYNLVLAIERTYITTHYQELSKGFKFNAKSTHASTAREVYVLVIGETARASNFSLYGYERNTTPQLDSLHGLTIFTDALTQSNTTHKSVPMLLSAASAENFECLYQQKGIITAFKEAGFHTAFFSNQQRNHSFIDFLGEEAHQCVFIHDILPDNDNVKDIELLTLLEQELNKKYHKQFIVLHTYGSHFNYNERYLPCDGIFQPDNNMEAMANNRMSLINAYDNTIYQTDKFLGKIAQLLQKDDIQSAFIYTSDHGEDIFDDEREAFLHASPIPTCYQLHIPFLVWTSSEFTSHYPQISNHLQANSHKPIATSASVFHTMLHLAGITTSHRIDSLSVASDAYKKHPRYYLNDHNHPKRMDQIGLTENDLNYFHKKQISFP